MEKNMLEAIKKRIDELAVELDRSMANHNAIVGALNEAKYLYQLAEKAVPVVEEIVAAVAE